jgi:hypothetical protein
LAQAGGFRLLERLQFLTDDSLNFQWTEQKMISTTPSASPPRRIQIPFLIDLVFVSDPDQIKKIEASGAVDRLHFYETQDLPFWLRFFFKATKFHDPQRDLWFCPFEATANPTYYPRRAYLEEKVAIGYQPEEVEKIARLLQANADEAELAHEMVQVVNRRFFDRDIPREISQSANYTLQDFGEAILPWKYLRGKKAQEKMMNYCEQNLPPGVHILDVGHNIGEVVQATAKALRTLKDNLDQPVEEIFTQQALTAQAPRIATQASTFDGLLSSPATPGKTVFILKIAEAAAQTGDLLFTFSTGRAERACVFQGFFLSFMKDVQQKLREFNS